jgi:hypothetical protein
VSVDIREEALTLTALERHAAIPIAFVVDPILDVTLIDFHRKMGCTLGAIDRFAYPGLPGEVQLLWWKPLAGNHPGLREP